MSSRALPELIKNHENEESARHSGKKGLNIKRVFHDSHSMSKQKFHSHKKIISIWFSSYDKQVKENKLILQDQWTTNKLDREIKA